MTRVALTSDRYPETAPVYEQVGLIPVSLPCISVQVAAEEVLSAARSAAEKADLVMVTSSRTLEILWPTGMPSLQVIAVGRVTARKAARAGAVVAATGSSGLASTIEANLQTLSGRRVAFPHARESDPVLVDLLREAVGLLDDHEIYRTASVAPPDTTVDAVTFASPSAVDGWHLGRDLTGLTVASIGDTTTRALARWRIPDVVAPNPSHLALARALAERLAS